MTNGDLTSPPSNIGLSTVLSSRDVGVCHSAKGDPVSRARHLVPSSVGDIIDVTKFVRMQFSAVWKSVGVVENCRATLVLLDNHHSGPTLSASADLSTSLEMMHQSDRHHHSYSVTDTDMWKHIAPVVSDSKSRAKS